VIDIRNELIFEGAKLRTSVLEYNWKVLVGKVRVMFQRRRPEAIRILLKSRKWTLNYANTESLVEWELQTRNNSIIVVSSLLDVFAVRFVMSLLAVLNCDHKKLLWYGNDGWWCLVMMI
jgi:hypothetical protein